MPGNGTSRPVGSTAQGLNDNENAKYIF